MYTPTNKKNWRLIHTPKLSINLEHWGGYILIPSLVANFIHSLYTSTGKIRNRREFIQHTKEYKQDLQEKQKKVERKFSKERGVCDQLTYDEPKNLLDSDIKPPARLLNQLINLNQLTLSAHLFLLCFVIVSQNLLLTLKLF